MGTYILKRLLLMPVTLLGITLISFLIIVLAPGTSGGGGAAGEAKIGRLSPRQLEVMEQCFHIGRPWYMRYFHWLGVIQPDPTFGQWRDLKKKRARELADAAALRAERCSGAEREAALAEEKRCKGYLTAIVFQASLAGSHKEKGPKLGEEWESLDREISQQVRMPRQGLIYLDFGMSVSQPSVSVWQRLSEAIPVTILLNILCFLIIYAFAIPLGVAGAVRHNTWADRALTIVLFILYSLPSFWVALLLTQLMQKVPRSLALPCQGLLPSGAESLPTLSYLWAGAQHLVLPVICLSFHGIASLSRYMRAGMLDVLRQDYVRTAWAKGAPPRLVVYKHAMRNALIPIVTMFGGLLPGLIGGSMIIESIFGIPGMGNLGYQALLTRDYTVLMADVTIGAVLVLLGILISDLLYVVVDPRITFEKAR